MADEEKTDLTDQIYNALTELGNIGAGNAVTSLSKMLSSKLTMSPPQVEVYDFNSLEDVIGDADTTVVSVLSTIWGELHAMILFVVGLEDAKQLVETLLQEEIDWHSEIGMSAIEEVANIIIGSYVASLETLSGKAIRYTLPHICIDMAGAIFSIPCTALGTVSDKALLINSHFQVEGKEINGYIMMVSEVYSYDMLLRQLGIGGIDG